MLTLVGILLTLAILAAQRFIHRAQASATAAQMAFVRDGLLGFAASCEGLPVSTESGGDPGLAYPPEQHPVLGRALPRSLAHQHVVREPQHLPVPGRARQHGCPERPGPRLARRRCARLRGRAPVRRAGPAQLERAGGGRSRSRSATTTGNRLPVKELGQCVRHLEEPALFRCRQCDDAVCVRCRAAGERDLCDVCGQYRQDAAEREARAAAGEEPAPAARSASAGAATWSRLLVVLNLAVGALPGARGPSR